MDEEQRRPIAGLLKAHAELDDIHDVACEKPDLQPALAAE